MATAEGQRARIDPFDPARDGPALAELDWIRSLDPVMGGWVARTGGPGTAVVRDAVSTDADMRPAIGVLDANELSGYPGVANVSIFTDTERARGGIALEAYRLFVDRLFEEGARVIHHEVLEMNGPIQRVMRGLRVSSSARYRQHAYVAGRWWDVLVFSFDEAHWRGVLERMPNLPRRAPETTGTDEDTTGEP